MKTILTVLPRCFAVLGSVIGFLLGGFDGYLYTLLGLILIDYLTGLVLAAAKRQVSSQIGFVGIMKKMLILVMVALGHLLDVNLLGGGAALRTAVIFFYAANEGISITENLAALGFPMPQQLKQVLKQLSED
ncbi:holin family protein [Acetobacterium sp. KB-1]|jgi:toxin secretion/phage lysis holin|uniref:phage holin family protein n=1 Tax=Acetobacterium sp. KB-1 TaxID=2184575 RepID=UPI000DBEB8FE|nr:phage holin family protein [Acetobacterium sp. KB-1]AWW26582.1 holin [Acetobacterium sp. KB-1]